MSEDNYNGSRLTAHGSRLTAHGSRLTAHGQSDSPSGKLISFNEFRKFCEDIINNFNGSRPYFTDHTLRLYNTFKFVVKLTGGRTGLSLLAPGGGPAFVEACLAKFFGFKCTILDLPEAIARYKEYYDWAGFETISKNIDLYSHDDSRTYDIVMSLENIEHIHAAPSEYVAKFVDDLAPGGYFIISTPNLGSIVHISKLLVMLPILDDPKITFDLNSHVHYREYMPCEIIEACEVNGLTFSTTAYTNNNTIRDASSRSEYWETRSAASHYLKNPVVRFIYKWSRFGVKALFGLIPRFRNTMIVATQKPSTPKE